MFQKLKQLAIDSSFEIRGIDILNVFVSNLYLTNQIIDLVENSSLLSSHAAQNARGSGQPVR
jgi:hypothetical protein